MTNTIGTTNRTHSPAANSATTYYYVVEATNANGTSASTNQATATAAALQLSTAMPEFSVPAGSYTAIQTVSISDATAGAVIYFTTDGSTPTVQSTQYSAPITVGATETVQAIALAPNDNASAVASALYVITLSTPVAPLRHRQPFAGDCHGRRRGIYAHVERQWIRHWVHCLLGFDGTDDYLRQRNAVDRCCIRQPDCIRGRYGNLGSKPHFKRKLLERDDLPGGFANASTTPIITTTTTNDGWQHGELSGRIAFNAEQCIGLLP